MHVKDLKRKNTISFGTIVWFVLGLIIPFWLISLPICWYFALRCYRSGISEVDVLKVTKDEKLNKLALLLASGKISEEQFQSKKAEILLDV